jgi:hypothetical protein
VGRQNPVGGAFHGRLCLDVRRLAAATAIDSLIVMVL